MFLSFTLKGLERFLEKELVNFKRIGRFYITEEKPNARSAVAILKILKITNDFEELLNVKTNAETFSIKVLGVDKEDIKEEFIERIKLKLRYSHPDIRFILVHTEYQFILGVDASEKRDYRIFTTRYSLNPIAAYALSEFGFCRDTGFIVTTDGSPLIEFLLKHGGTARGYCLERSLFNGVRKNVLLSGVKAELHENLDELSSFERIVLPLNFSITKAGIRSEKLLEIAREHAKQIVILTLPSLENKLVRNFEVVGRISFFQGKLEMAMLLIKT